MAASTSSPPSADVTPLAVPPRDACRLLSISTTRLYELLRSGALPSYWDGRSRRITVAAIHQYIAGRIADADRRHASQCRRREQRRPSREKGREWAF